MLIWSDPKLPSKDCPYDHVVAETPLGPIRIEWKSWKRYDGRCAEMPWGEFCSAEDLDDAKAAVQAAWDRKVAEMAALTSPVASAPPSAEIEPSIARVYLMCGRKQWWHDTSGWTETHWQRFEYVECGIYEKPVADLTPEDREFWESYRSKPEDWVAPSENPAKEKPHG